MEERLKEKTNFMKENEKKGEPNKKRFKRRKSREIKIDFELGQKTYYR